MWVEKVAATLAVYSQLTKEDSNGRKKGSEGTPNHLTVTSKGLGLVNGHSAGGEALHLLWP